MKIKYDSWRGEHPRHTAVTVRVLDRAGHCLQERRMDSETFPRALLGLLRVIFATSPIVARGGEWEIAIRRWRA